MKFIDRIKAAAILSLTFNKYDLQRTSDGKNVAVLALVDPIPSVRGSQEVTLNGRNHPLIITDVMEVKIHEDDIEAVGEDLQWDEKTNTGSYKGGSLILDVAKASGQVWLKRESFQSSGRAYGNKIREDRLAKLVGAVPDAAAGNTAGAKPTAVATPKPEPAKVGP